MSGLKRAVLGISDLKNLFQSINYCYADDYSNFALSSLKRRIEDFMFGFHLLSIDDLIHKLEKDKSFYELFSRSILVDTTEMFRDPEFWDEMKNLVLKKYRYAENIKIWIPDCNSGDEMYTLQIVLDELKLMDKSKAYVTTSSEFNVERILKATVEQKKMETNIANFDRYMEGGKLLNYFVVKANASILKPELLENVDIEKRNILKDEISGAYDFILFRNKMLYYNPQLKNEILKKLTATLKPGGYIAVGIKESIDYPMWEKDYLIISDSERIYKRVME